MDGSVSFSERTANYSTGFRCGIRSPELCRSAVVRLELLHGLLLGPKTGFLLETVPFICLLRKIRRVV